MKILSMPKTIIRKRDRRSCTWSLLDTIQHSLLSLKGLVSNSSFGGGGGGGGGCGGGGGWGSCGGGDGPGDSTQCSRCLPYSAVFWCYRRAVLPLGSWVWSDLHYLKLFLFFRKELTCPPLILLLVFLVSILAHIFLPSGSHYLIPLKESTKQNTDI